MPLWAGFTLYYFIRYNPASLSQMQQLWIRPVMAFLFDFELIFQQVFLALKVAALLGSSCILAYALGRMIVLQLLQIPCTSLRKRIVLCLPMGLGTLTLMILGVGLCGLYHPVFFYAFP